MKSKHPGQQKRTLGRIHTLMPWVGILLLFLIIRTQKPGWIDVQETGAQMTADQISLIIRNEMEAHHTELSANSIRSVLTTYPWVADADVRRIWPHGIRINITEHQVAARWDEVGWMNLRGQVFAALHDLPNPPPVLKLTGPEQAKAYILAQSLIWGDILSAHNLELAHAHMNKDRSWKLRVKPHIEIRMGSDMEHNTTQLSSFLAHNWSDLSMRKNSIQGIDLNYPDGYAAVSYKDSAPLSKEVSS